MEEIRYRDNFTKYERIVIVSLVVENHLNMSPSFPDNNRLNKILVIYVSVCLKVVTYVYKKRQQITLHKVTMKLQKFSFK